jgi:hypothetical protein
MVACAKFLGRSVSTCTRGEVCVCHREDEIRRAVAYNDGKWPSQLWTGIMFFNGLRITKQEFIAQGGEA